MKKLLAYIVLAVVVIGGGCIGTLSEELTPARIDKDVVAYNEEAGTGTAEDYTGLLYPSLASVKRLQADFEAAVVVTNQALQHLVEQKQLQADILKGIVDNDVEIAAAREDWAFNPTTGVFAIGLGLAGISAGGILGLMRKRPKDITPEEMTAALKDIRGEVDERDRRIVEIVSSVKNMLEAQPEAQREDMVKMLKAHQLPDTRVAVKQALALAKL
jgi:hypothetical protein